MKKKREIQLDFESDASNKTEKAPSADKSPAAASDDTVNEENPEPTTADESKIKDADMIGYNTDSDESSSEDGKVKEAIDDTFSAVSPIDADPDLSGYDASVMGGFEDKGLFELESMETFLGTDTEYASLPLPEVFNEYPPEVQRKIMEWTDRDVKARRDDESRRQDEYMRAKVAHDRMKQNIPAMIIVLALLCGAVTSVITGNPLFALVFMIVPIVVVVAYIVTDDGTRDKSGRRRNFPWSR